MNVSDFLTIKLLASSLALQKWFDFAFHAKFVRRQSMKFLLLSILLICNVLFAQDQKTSFDSSRINDSDFAVLLSRIETTLSEFENEYTKINAEKDQSTNSNQIVLIKRNREVALKGIANSRSIILKLRSRRTVLFEHMLFLYLNSLDSLSDEMEFHEIAAGIGLSDFKKSKSDLNAILWILDGDIEVRIAALEKEACK